MSRAFSVRQIIALFLATFLSLSVVTTAWGAYAPLLNLNENQILYLFSTSAQVIGAIYGLTLTGYAFLREDLNREVAEDDSLREPVEALTARYFVLLMFITALVAASLGLANFAIAVESSSNSHLVRFAINSGQSAFFTALCAISYFIFDVISPQRIERASQALQREIDPSGEQSQNGSLEVFLTNYNEIERLLNVVAGRFQNTPITSADMGGRYARRISNSRLVEMLARSGRITEQLHRQLRELITLRNSIIHGAEPVVSQQIVAMSAEALANLQRELGAIEDVE